jgi:DNA-binding transcriptional ArsR family regulator
MMADDLETFGEIRQIRMRIEAIEHTQEVQIRAHRETIEKDIWDQMDGDGVLAQVYLLVDGHRSQKDIVEAMQEQGAAVASQPTVSRKLDKLSEMHLIEVVDRTKSGNIYKRTAIDRILGIARKLEKRRAKPAADKS